jgi:hypothetical protein
VGHRQAPDHHERGGAEGRCDFGPSPLRTARWSSDRRAHASFYARTLDIRHRWLRSHYELAQAGLFRSTLGAGLEVSAHRSRVLVGELVT